MFKGQIIGVLLFMLSTVVHTTWAQGVTDAEKGKDLYLVLCSPCHGMEGAGGEGPGLNRPILTRATDNQALRVIIRDGIPDRGMPRIRQFSDTELDSLVSFVRSLGRVGKGTLTGSPIRGKVIYQRLGCSSCHTIGGEGGTFGPELTNSGAYRGAEYLRQAIVDPGAAPPRGVMSAPGRSFNEFPSVRIVTREGLEVMGLRVNEDSFTIQIRDAGNRLYSFRKADLQTLDKKPKKSLMPEYKTRILTSELDDLVAYLSSLGGA